MIKKSKKAWKSINVKWIYLKHTKRKTLIFIFFILLVLIDLEVAKFIALLRISHNTQPVSEVVLLQILLSKILQVPEDIRKVLQWSVKWNYTWRCNHFQIDYNSAGGEKVLKPFGEGNLRRNCDLAFAPLNSYDSTAEVSCFAVHFDALLKELLLWTHAHTHNNIKL